MCEIKGCDQEETWLPVVGYEDTYRVSSCGRVWSVPRVVPHGDGVRNLKGKYLTPRVGKRGYLIINLNARDTLRVHRLVLEAFVGPCPPGMETRHLDSDPAHNCLRNLCWGTKAENGADRVARRPPCPQGHQRVAPNLVKAALARGRHACRACHLARAFLSNHRARGDETVYDLQELSDRYYVEIMSA